MNPLRPYILDDAAAADWLSAAVSPSRMAVGPRAGLPPRADHGARGLGDHLEAPDRVGHANGVDRLIGRTLPSMASELGLGPPQARTDVQNIRWTPVLDDDSCVGTQPVA